MWKQDESETREGRRNVSKLFLQNDVDSWDPASEGGDETEIAQLAAFLEHRAARTRRTMKQINTSAIYVVKMVGFLLHSGF